MSQIEFFWFMIPFLCSMVNTTEINFDLIFEKFILIVFIVTRVPCLNSITLFFLKICRRKKAAAL